MEVKIKLNNIPIAVDHKRAYAVLAQIKTMSVSRLYSKLDKLSEDELKSIENGLAKLIKRL